MFDVARKKNKKHKIQDVHKKQGTHDLMIYEIYKIHRTGVTESASIEVSKTVHLDSDGLRGANGLAQFARNAATFARTVENAAATTSLYIGHTCRRADQRP